MAELIVLALPFLARIGLRRGLAHLTLRGLLLLWLIVGAERGSRAEDIEGIRLRWAELLPELRAEFRRHRCRGCAVRLGGHVHVLTRRAPRYGQGAGSTGQGIFFVTGPEPPGNVLSP